MKVATILDNIDLGEIGLPEFQRGYVWKREQVRRFMNSLYRGWPVGSLLEWNPPVEKADTRSGPTKKEGTIRLLIDGQQRVTTLYGISRGKAPRFFDGNSRNFLSLYFHLDTEEFEFYGPVKMQHDPRWISVTRLLQEGIAPFIQQFIAAEIGQQQLSDYVDRMDQLKGILEKDFHIESISGLNSDIDEVVNIFNEVNSGGTQLSSGDLALAKICAEWPQAREEMQKCLHKWARAGYDSFTLEWLLRCVNATLTGRARFNALSDVSREQFEDGLKRTERYIDELLNQIGMQLGLDHSGVIRSPMFLALMSRYLDLSGGLLGGEYEIANLLYLYVNSFLWGRYSYSQEAVLQQDLSAIEDGGNEFERIDNLIGNFKGANCLLWPTPEAFRLSTTATRFYPLLYMLTRIGSARDLFRNYPLSSNLIGNPLERHHIFPKSLLYNHGYKRREVNQLANFAFLVADTNRRISNRLPEVYLAECEARNPGVLASQWIPQDLALWKLANFHDFVAARRDMLAQAADELLNRLYDGKLPGSGDLARMIENRMYERPEHIAGDEEEQTLLDCQTWMRAHGLPAGEFGYELFDKATGKFLAILDLAWPVGVQFRRSDPVALLLDEDAKVHTLVQQQGFLYYTSVVDFKSYIEREFPD